MLYHKALACESRVCTIVRAKERSVHNTHVGRGSHICGRVVHTLLGWCWQDGIAMFFDV